MIEITAHKANGLNEAIKILALDAPGAGGAHHVYELSGAGATVRLEFQNGPIKEAGFNGISNEALLAVVAHRLECFQAGPFACKDNDDALAMVKGGLTCLLKRTKKRVEQGVEGKNIQHVEPPALATTRPPEGTVFTQSSPTAVKPAEDAVARGGLGGQTEDPTPDGRAGSEPAGKKKRFGLF